MQVGKKGAEFAPFFICPPREGGDPRCPMIHITLPDGSVRQFDNPVTVKDVAAAIGPGLAKAALGGKVDGKLVDTSHAVERDARVAIVTDRDPEGLELIRH